VTPAWAIALAVPLSVSWIVISVLARSRSAARLRDIPNERSLHSIPTPRVGGLGLMAGALPIAFALGDASIRAAVACALVLAIVSLLDDLRGLPIAVRLPAHVVAAGVSLLAIGAPSGTNGGMGMVEAGLALAAIVWMTNLYNFMDGSDGLAGGMAIVGFGALSIAACEARAPGLALACAAIASASAGFLAHNFPPARVFLGDAGSIPLGLLASVLGVDGVARGAWPAWFPFLVFSPFIVDATLTLARRAVTREPIWKAHRTHAYQRLVLAGWAPRRLALVAYALMVGVAASALAARASGATLRVGIICVWVAAYALLFIAIRRRTRTA
jgi:UDP-N-acetylmuramyl pentapeptide phosphotransferase/UDP-N-acetylglucosamine-1-phosphate transferase